MKTRTRNPPAAAAPNDDPDNPSSSSSSTAQPLQPSMSRPPQVFVLPEAASPHARLATLPHPATAAPTRFLVCPAQGVYELTRLAAPRRACRSWLLAPEARRPADGAADEEAQGYVLQTPDLLVATPVDPLFLVLPALAGSGRALAKEYLAATDYVSSMGAAAPQLRQILEGNPASELARTVEARIEAVCDGMDMGDEKLFCLSISKLARELVGKAQRMSAGGLPASMEEKFVRQALEVPVLGIKREMSGVSVASEDGGAADSDVSSQPTSQDTSTSTDSASTAATSVLADDDTRSTPIAHLLRLRTALTFLLSSYIPARLHTPLQTAFADAKLVGVDFAPLDAHLARVAGLKAQAQALRALSDNISRKRSSAEDDEELAAKRRKKEVEEEKKKNVSLGVRKLAKADTSGMKKLSAFFAKKS